MIGFVIKDLLVLRKTVKLYLLILAFYLALTVAGLFDSNMVPGFAVMFTMMLPISSFAYDELARWEKYGASLPAGRRGMVGGKYLLVVLLGAAAVAMIGVAALLMTLFSDRAQAGLMLQTGVVLTCAGTLINCVLLPLLFRFGAEKGRLFMMGIFVVLFLGGVSVVKLLSAGRLSLPEQLPFPWLMGLAALAALGLLTYLSYRISLGIYAKKEL
ncbi:hypothetical protein SDC9_47661 [bioreactor metagenome]|uniref:ABC-2 transporter permease n=1 Tax=bioreactor metagenome TaxID=1076179 RepID=A0A644WD62_9ZZZZ